MRVDDLPKAAEFWERPEPSKEGETEPNEIYMAVGLALTKWEILETYFSFLFARFVESESRAAKRAYGSIVAAGGRRDALSEAAEVYFVSKNTPKVDQDRFRRLLDHFGRASGRRNDIAHGHVIAFIGQPRNHFFLVPPEYNSNKTDAFPSWDRYFKDFFAGITLGDYRYVRKDIIHFSNRFAKLGDAAIEYWRHLEPNPPDARTQ